MFDFSLLSLILIPFLAYLLTRKPREHGDVLRDYIIPHGMDVRSCATHWGVPAGVSRFNSALFSEVKCHPDFVERSVPACWFKWTAADARRRARARIVPREESRVLMIRKPA
ncbi:MAG TPA: hypothetical protein VGL65_12485 [Gemmatimonadales bacterium]|jgi:hypothetical protein